MRKRRWLSCSLFGPLLGFAILSQSSAAQASLGPVESGGSATVALNQVAADLPSAANEWAWMGGSSTMSCGTTGCGQPGVYGTLSTPAAGNVPGGRSAAATWSDSGGHLWLFGGSGYDANGIRGYLNDLWEFNPSTNEWAWMGGSSALPGSGSGQYGVYGTLGKPASENVPGGRDAATSWRDLSGHLWLFGGEGFDANGNYGYLNDLWELDPSTNLWTWMGGSSTVPSWGYGQPGTYGTLGTPASGNIPGGRYGATSWTDLSGYLWLFGGYGSDASGIGGYLSDLWEFDPSINEWAWMGGTSTVGSIGVYGTLGVPAAINKPGSRLGATSWTDGNGDLWLFGGFGFDATGDDGALNDLWEFNPATNKWTWTGGSNMVSQSGVYGKLGTPATGNIPGSRLGSARWTDSGGNLWLFGGAANWMGGSGEGNDLWEFDPSVNEWAWMGGSSTADQPGVYGALGTPAGGNNPGGSLNAASWTDSHGIFWFFGGYGYDASGNAGSLNSLWRYQASDAPLQAASPTFSVAAGAFTSPLSLRLADATAGATIYYTLDGNTPTAKSTKYATALAIAKTTTVKAIAEASGYANSAVASATYTILKPQTISFRQPASPVTYGVKPITLSATASSGLPVVFRVQFGSARVSGATLTITGAGAVVVAANQPGNTIYGAAAQVTRTITVNKATQSVSFAPPASPVVYGVKPIALSAKAGSGLAVTFRVLSGPATVSGSTLTITGAGTVVVAANQPGNAYYVAATQVTRSITVNKARLTVTANSLTMKQGKAVPALTYAVNGFVNRDTQAKATTGQPLLSTTAISKSAPGKYPITVKAGTLAAANYSIALVNGTLTVTK